MPTILVIFALLGIIGGTITSFTASTVFQQIVGGMSILTGFICLIGGLLLAEVTDWRKRWNAVQEESFLNAYSVQKSTDELMVAVNRLRQEQEQTNALLQWLGKIQQQKNPPSDEDTAPLPN